MVATYDMYEPIAGGFRGRLNADLTLINGSIGPVAVSLNATGKVVVGTDAQSGMVGVLVKNVARGPVGAWGTSLHGGTPNPYAPIGAKAGDAVDIMTNGQIVGLDKTDFPAGTRFYAKADGTLVDDADEGNIPVGWTVEAGRLIVRISAGNVAIPPAEEPA